MGTFHGLRTVETSLFDESEKKFYDSFEVQDSEYIYNVDGRIRELAVESYGKALRAFTNRQIIVDSEHSKYSMRYYYPDIFPDEITVLYAPLKQLSHSINGFDEQIFLDKIGIEKQNYGLMVSAGIYYKNPIRVLLAYDRLFSANYVEISSTYKVVVTGIKNKEGILNKLSNHDRFILLEYVEDNELEILYKNAQLFIYPSLNEGFGYPPLEAMKYGTICACSVNTSIPEVCKNMVLYFNPLLIDEICIRILQSFSEKIRDEKQKEISKELPKIQQRQKEDLIKLVDIMLGVEDECK
jgi:glycosyltransferase involved in cell wall biosynthesis